MFHVAVPRQADLDFQLAAGAATLSLPYFRKILAPWSWLKRLPDPLHQATAALWDLLNATGAA